MTRRLLRGIACRRERPGFTLIEMLVVIVIISLAASITTFNLAAASESANLRSIAARWQDMDARARLFARTGGPVIMSLNGSGLTLHRHGSTELLAEIFLPAAISAQLQHDDNPLEAVLFDRTGRTFDYRATLQHGQSVHRWAVCGATGHVIEDGVDGGPQ